MGFHLPRIARGPAILAAAIAGIAGLATAAPAATAPSATGEVRYDFTSLYTLGNVINYNRYTDTSGGFSTGSDRESFAPGANTLIQRDIEKPIAVTYLMGTSALGTTSPNHLVVALNDGFAASAVGREFATVFGTTYLDGTAFDEQDVIGALQSLYNPGSSDDAIGAAVGTVFRFSDLVVARGGGFAASGTPFTLVGFSIGQAAGTGTALASGAAAAIPEPTTWAMMAGGFGLAGAALRRRRRAGGFAAI